MKNKSALKISTITVSLMIERFAGLWRLRHSPVERRHLGSHAVWVYKLLESHALRRLRIQRPRFDPPGAWRLSPIRLCGNDSLRRKRRTFHWTEHTVVNGVSLSPRLHGQGYRYLQRQSRLHRIGHSEHPQ